MASPGRQSTSPRKILEGTHYYLENGNLVFTEKYHLERGYCCKSGCRHCPYGFNQQFSSKDTSTKHQPPSPTLKR
ncbi:MAG: DUF5522 domain-containing protein [Saprospiraceae bacterium]